MRIYSGIMKIKVLIFFFAASIATAFSQEKASTPPTNCDSAFEISALFNNFKDMHKAYFGTTQDCKPYYIYAFKYKKTWFLIVQQTKGGSMLIVRPPRSEENKIDDASKFSITAISKAYINNYTKLKKRKRDVLDMSFYGIYKFNRPGRKAIKGLLLFEYPQIEEEASKPEVPGKPEKPAKPEVPAKPVAPEAPATPAIPTINSIVK